MPAITFHSAGPQRPRRIFAGMQLVDNPGVGKWIETRIDHTGRGVHGVVPSGFGAYAVVFHPAFCEVAADEQPSLFAPEELRRNAGDDAMVYYREVRWSAVAVTNGHVVHPAMEWAAITGHWAYRSGGEQPGLWDIGPQRGSLPLGPTVRVCRLLADHTTTPAECFFAVSMIYGDLPDYVRQATQVLDAHAVSGPLLALPSHSFEGPPTGFRYRAPNLWWPSDRAWFLQSNYDLQETYVGGSQACIDALVADPELEALQIDPSQTLADDVNPEPAGAYGG
jgi:hypothetical protein